ncbi:uncharacterized protein LOC135463043 [Liolophura sinensis]|uniref:uncharacterized protein LOC135463043 n=1 Tax=Liolophura sinensis TaxID=3198878 RepID=UPI0031589673
MALVAVTLSAVKPVNTWAKEDLDGILRDGDRNHGALLARLGRLGQTNQRVGIYEMMRCSCLSITLGDQCYAMAGVKDTEVIGMVSTTPMDEATMEAFQMVDLQTGLERALNGSDGAVVTIGDYSTAFIRDPRGGVRVWDSHCRGRDGLFRRNGRAVLLTLGSLDDVTPFVIKKLRSRKQTEAQYEVAGFQLVEK